MSGDDTGTRLRCLVTCATGYIGGRPVPEHLVAGHRLADARVRGRPTTPRTMPHDLFAPPARSQP